MIDYRQLETLAAIFEEKSFRGAASRLHITQPAVSQRLRALEQLAGQPLLIRSNPPRLTSAGERFYRHHVQVTALESALRDTHDGNSWTQLSVAIERDSLSSWFADAVCTYLQQHRVLLNVIGAHEDTALQYLSDGRIFGCIASARASLSGCTSRAIGTAEYVCVAAPRVQKSVKAGKNPRSELGNIPILTYDGADRLHVRFLAKVGVDSDRVGVHIIPNHHLYYELLLAGVGFGLVPAREAKRHLRSGKLVELLPGKHVSIPLYWHAWELQTPLVQQLSDSIVAQAREYLRAR